MTLYWNGAAVLKFEKHNLNMHDSDFDSLLLYCVLTLVFGTKCNTHMHRGKKKTLQF